MLREKRAKRKGERVWNESTAHAHTRETGAGPVLSAQKKATGQTLLQHHGVDVTRFQVLRGKNQGDKNYVKIK